MAIGKTNAGGGGSGATLTVTGVAGATVTASKDGKTYTRTINSAGIAVFKGLATGTWTITMSGGGQTSTRTITITADYELTIAYFSATISITYPANSSCVVTDSSGATVDSDTNTDTNAKTWTATVGATGTYTVTATATDGSGKTKSTTVSITTNGQVATVTLAYELVLFDGLNGGDNTDVTGGWKLSENYTYGSDLNVTAESITVSNGGREDYGSWYGGTARATTKNTIDFSSYSTAEIKVTTAYANAEILVGEAKLGISTAGTYTLDISNVTSGTVQITAVRPSETWGKYRTVVTNIRLY